MKTPREEPLKDPMASARRLATRVRPKRFYSEARMVEEGGKPTLHLDGRRAMTPGRNPLAVTNARLADAIVAEWRGQGDEIDPATMPATRLANSAIDGVAGRMQAVRDEILAYAKTDLIYYRAGEPRALVERQHQAWDPVLAWAERRYGHRFILAEGIAHVAQSPAALAAMGADLLTFDDPFDLAALHLATTLTGSALIALALAAGTLTAEAAWAAAHVDEDWNISKWGEDAEAAEHRAHRREDFGAAALVLTPT